MLGLYIDILIEYLFRIVVRFVRKQRSSSWPLNQATVMHAVCPKPGLGCRVVQVGYTYRVDGESYAGTSSKPFLFDVSAEDYVKRHPAGTEIRVRVKPEEPARSVMVDRPWTLTASGS